ncbi:MAG: hypothetical protein JXR37_25165 [Kiritimatiellae bacterium]|nr:hypothetical protein [Kiritimatiellia bacterium]
MRTGRRERLFRARLIGMLLVLPAVIVTRAQTAVDLEGGVVLSGYNDVRIPGDGGTKLSLVDDLDAEPAAYWRVRLGYALGAKHHLSLLAAPLTVKADGVADREVVFAGQTFAAGTALDATYRFDSYRATYRYDFRRSPRLTAGIGFTAKIRDAAVQLESAGERAEDKNTGFVPLLHVRARWAVVERMGVLLEADALAAPQGRAEDLLIALQYEASPRVSVRGGYRLLEGGADNDEVYTFALFHYFGLGVTVRL